MRLIEKDEILEAVLAEAEQRFGYERTVEKHPKYQCMTRYLYKVSEGLAETNSTNSVKKVESYAGNLKKGNQLSLELLGKTSSTGSGSSTDQQEVMSDSYKILAEKHKRAQQPSFQVEGELRRARADQDNDRKHE